MLNKEQLKEKMQTVLLTQYPEEAEIYKIALINTEAVDPESDFIKRLVLDFQLAFNSDRYDSVSNLYMACRELGLALREDELVLELKTLWDGTKRGLSIPDLEYLILKGIKGGLQKEYELDGEKFTLSGLNRLLKNNKLDIYDVFGQMQMLYNIKPADFDWSAQISRKDANVSFDDLKV